jgi:PleD family two-component response regulator
VATDGSMIATLDKFLQLILVVDDNPDVRLALATLLQDEGFEVAEASDGDVGLDSARERKPDLTSGPHDAAYGRL